MNCLNIAELIDERDSGRLTAAERRDVEAHLNACPECRAVFGAHEAMRATAVPAMSPGLADRCRRLVAAQSAGRAHRAGGRPFVVVGLLVAGAAAAAVVGLNLVNGSGADADFIADTVRAPASIPDAGESSAVPVADTAAEAEPTSAAVDATATSGGFTVAVTFRQRSDNPEVIRVSETVYRAFLEELRKIPDLELIELESADPEMPGSEIAGVVMSYPAVAEVQGVQVDQQAAGAEFSVASAELQTTPDGSRTLVLVDSGRIEATGSGIGGAETFDLSAIPAALVGRVETVTGGAAASFGDAAAAGVVNVILDNNIEGVRVDLDYSSASFRPALEPPPLAHDYELEVVSSTRPPGDSWNFNVNARSRSQVSSFGSGARIGEYVIPAELIAPLVAALRERMFPVDQTTLTALEQRVIDTSLPIDERLRELKRLTQMHERSANTVLADAVALAVADMVSRIADDRQRLSLWESLAGVDNPILVQPLSNALRNDSNEALRIEVALLLAKYQEDPVARAALDAAANADLSPVVRETARWAALDSAGRRDFVAASLIDTRLSDAERIETLLSDPGRGRIAPVDLSPAIDATVVNELAALLRRLEQAPTRARVLTRLGREISPALTPLFVERLAEDEADGVRSTAANALGRRLDEPGVRAALERAAASDPSLLVRTMAASILANGI